MAGEKKSLGWLWGGLMIIGLLIFGSSALSSLFYLISGNFNMSIWGVFKIFPILISALLIWGLISLFSKKTNSVDNKIYKAQKHLEPMKMQSVFYFVGVIFIFISVWYFAREYISQFSNGVKMILLVVSVVVSFVIAEFMRGADI